VSSTVKEIIFFRQKQNGGMSEEQEFIDQLDLLIKGHLGGEQVAQLEFKISNDPRLRVAAENHKGFINALERHHRRAELRNSLDQIHSELKSETGENASETLSGRNRYFIKRYWVITAVAASVMLISVLATVLVTEGWDRRQADYYKELRRNVEQIKKSQTQILADIAETKRKAVLLPGKFAGSGFLISANGYAVTSYHVIKEADSVFVENAKYGRLKVTVVYSNPDNDLSVLHIDDENFRVGPLPYTISKLEANLGEDAFTLGFPREEIVFGDGSISAATGYRQNPNAYQISVPVNPGNSGGPLLNEKGNLIGIISGSQMQTSGTAFAVKSTVLLDVLKEMPVGSLFKPVVLPSQNQLKNLTRVQQITQIRDFVFIVRVYK
jgi:serine protease Do